MATRSETSAPSEGPAPAVSTIAIGTPTSAPATHRFQGRPQMVDSPWQATDVDADDEVPSEPTGDDEAEDDEAEDDELEGEESAEQADGDEPEGEPEAQADTGDKMAEWIRIVRETPSRIAEVPGKQRGNVLANAFESERVTARNAITDAFNRGREAALAEAELREAVADIDTLRAKDAEGFVEWQEKNPAQYQVYRQFKAAESVTPAERQRLAQESSEVNRDGLQYAQKLLPYPAALAKVQANTYASTNAGYRQLVKDVDAALAEAQANGANGKKAAAATKAAVNGLKGTPKIGATSGGKAPPGDLTWEYLQSLPQGEIDKLMETPEGEARVDKALAKGPRHR